MKKSIESNIDEIIVALCYNLGMIEEDNILISKQTLSGLQSLAATLIKIIKISDGERKKNAESTLSEVVGFIDKALKGEIMTPEQYTKKYLGLLGGREGAIKLIEDSKRRTDELAKRPKRTKGDNL